MSETNASQSVIDVIEEFKLYGCKDYIKEFKKENGFLFIELFNDILTIDKTFIEKVGLSSNLYFISILIADKIIDEKKEPINNEALLLSYVAREKSLHILYQIFPPEHDYWKHFNQYKKEYINALTLETKINSCEIKTYSIEIANQIYVGNAAFAKAAIAASCYYSKNTEYLTKLEKSMDYFNLARNFFDNVEDWRKDIESKQYSFLLKNIIDEYELDIETLSKDDIGKFVFFSGKAIDVLDQALNFYQKAIDEVVNINCLKWKGFVSRYLTKCQLMKEDLEKLIEKQLIIADIKKVNLKRNFQIQYPSSRNLYQSLATDAMRYIEAEFNKGFIEVSNNQYFKDLNGFTFDSRYHIGDIFQRAVISEILIESNELFNNTLDYLIGKEKEYILQSKPLKNVGWSFYPTLDVQPSDFDTTSQVLQIFLKSDDKIARKLALEPIEFLFKFRHYSDGSFGTWLIPDISNCNPMHLKQISFFKDYCSIDVIDNKDAEVIANILYTLYLLDKEKYREVIIKGVEYLEKVQEDEGFWKSSWYFGPLYGTYMCSRILSIIKPQSESLKKVLHFLKTSQNTDGGWGNKVKKSDPLNTSFGLICLAYLNEIHAIEMEQVDEAFDYLRNAKTKDNCWAQCDYINLVKNFNSVYRSRVITTAYVLKASFLWNKKSIR